MVNTPQSKGPLLENDQAFQCRMWTIQRYAWGVMAGIILVTLLGLCGPGPLSTRMAGTTSANLQLRYERFVRSFAPTDLYITLSSPPPSSATARIWLNRSYLDRVEVKRITPMPIEVSTSNHELGYTFRVENLTHSGIVTFTLHPTGFGRLSGLLRNGEGETVHFHHFVYP